MSTKDTIREMNRRSQARVRELVQAKREGTPLIEYNSTFIPEELIRAAGANTYFICRGGEPEPTDAVLDYMLRFMNPLSRSMAGYMELGLDPITPNADLVAIAETDCHVGRISELMEFKGVKVGKVGVPADWEKPVAFEYYANSIRELMKTVEEITGKSVDPAAAKKNLEVSNRINGLFRRLDALRRHGGHARRGRAPHREGRRHRGRPHRELRPQPLSRHPAHRPLPALLEAAL